MAAKKTAPKGKKTAKTSTVKAKAVPKGTAGKIAKAPAKRKAAPRTKKTATPAS